MSRLSPFRKIANPNKKELSPLTSSFQNNHSNYNDKYRHIRQTPVDSNKGKYYHEETHNTYKPTEKKKNDNIQIQNIIQKNRYLSAQNAQLYHMLQERGQIVTTLQKKLQEQIYREVTTLQAIQVEKNKFIVETQRKFKDYQRKIQQLIKEIYLLKEEKYQSNIIKAREIDLIKQSLNKEQLLRLQQFANGQMTAREATQMEHNKVKHMLSLQKNEREQLAFEYRNTTDKLKNEIITLNNQILHINHLRKIELSQQKIQYQNMIDNILKQSFKEKELINVEHDIAIKKLEQHLSSKNFENNKINELKKIGQIEQNVRQNQLLEKKSKLEDELKQLQQFYKRKNFQEAQNLIEINRIEVNAVSHGNESLILNLKAEIYKLINLNQTKSQEIQNLYAELETQRNLNNQQVKTLQNFIEELKHRAKEVQRSHLLQEEQLKIKWAQLSQANLITLKQFYQHELEVMSQQLQQKANLADSNRQKLHHELQDKNQMKKRFDLQCLKLNTRIAELQLQISQLIVAKKEQTGFLSSNMQLTSQKLIQHTRDREKLSANNEEDKKRLQELILAKDKQIEQLNTKIHFMRENYSKQIAQKNAELEIIKKHKEDVDMQLRKEKLFYQNEIKRKDILIKQNKERYDDQINRLRRNFKVQYDQLDQETSQKIKKLQLELKEMKAIEKNLQSEILTLKNYHETETIQNKNELVNEKERMSRQKKANEDCLTKFYKDEIEKQNRQIQDLRKQLSYKEEDLRRMADNYFCLQQKMAAVIQSQDKLRVIETKILSLGQQNNVVKNFAEIVKSKFSQ